MIDPQKTVPDLYWLALLLTGRRDASVDIALEGAASQDGASPFFQSWMRAWSRRIVIAKALTAIRDELARSARRTRLARISKSKVAPPGWSLSPSVTKAQIERALLAIDVFPRASVILRVFEGIGVADTVALLDADAPLIRKAQAIGLREFAANLAGKGEHSVPDFFRSLGLAQAN